jgi:sterol desaturase/sphingolipid hydroxylase (fatty acid hydroxylase superfamily)
MARDLASWSNFPLLVVVLGGFAVVGSTWDVATPLGLPPDANPGLLILACLAVFYPLVALLELVLPSRTDWSRAHDDVRTDALHLLFTGPLTSTLHEALLHGTLATAGIWLAGRIGVGLWPAGWPAAAQLGLALVVAEFGHYWFHRVSHESALVWRLHATHHSARRLYWLNATRFHPLDLFGLIACQSGPLFLLGAPPRTLLMYALFTIAYGQIQHCNVALRTPRAVDRVFSTPGVHRWHHSLDAREGNHNYGAILSCWDLLFGTYLRPAAPVTGPVGIADLPAFPTRYLGQLAAPFRWHRMTAKKAA